MLQRRGFKTPPGRTEDGKTEVPSQPGKRVTTQRNKNKNSRLIIQKPTWLSKINSAWRTEMEAAWAAGPPSSSCDTDTVFKNAAARRRPRLQGRGGGEKRKAERGREAEKEQTQTGCWRLHVLRLWQSKPGLLEEGEGGEAWTPEGTLMIQ